MIKLVGHLQKITYYNQDNHYMIARFVSDQNQHMLTVVGYLPGVEEGVPISIKGTWESHKKYGPQFKVESFEISLPSSIKGITKYLQSGIIKGIGPKIAKKIVKKFGEETFHVIEKEPEKLWEIEGLGKARAITITDGWKAHHMVRTLITFLQENGLNASLSAKIFSLYENDSVNILKKNPYQIAVDFPGTGFYIADTIARNMGADKDDPFRIRACIMNIMEQHVSEGHVYISLGLLINRCRDLYQIELCHAQKEIFDISEDGRVVIIDNNDKVEKQIVYPKELYKAEKEISNKIKAMMSVSCNKQHIDPDDVNNEILSRLAIKLSDEQFNILNKIFSHNVSILTGGPGTGKTTLIRSITTIFGFMGKEFLLAAPTGRATRRLSEVTRKKASTIHKLLKYNYIENTFEKNRDNPLRANVIIIDEASMIDTVLMFHLLNAIPVASVIILVGDIFQLPSVGPGNVLSDLIKSNVVPVFYLNKIFRQANESHIILNAHNVRKGLSIELKKSDYENEMSDFYFFEQYDPSKVAETVVDLCCNKIPEHFGYDPIKDIQVLTPMHKGEVGTINLNHILQRKLNKNKDGVENRGSMFKCGDKVMHLINNYQKNVYNGDIGTVLSIDKEGKTLLADFYGRDIIYEFEEMEELSLAYAISVHKSQGSEYPVVVIPITTQHYPLLQRNLLYTAITRGKQLVVIVGSEKALNISLNNDKPQKRLSSLDCRLTE